MNRDAVIEFIYDMQFFELIAYLMERWEDESEYEDLNEYLETIQKSIPCANRIRINTNQFLIYCQCIEGEIMLRLEAADDGYEFSYLLPRDDC